VLARLEPTEVEHLIVLYTNSRLLTLPKNIRQGWKVMEVANTLAYYDSTTITAVIKIILQAPGGKNWKFIYPNSLVKSIAFKVTNK
jgi:hypothetical protein